MDGNAFAPLKLNHLYTHEMMLCQRGMEIREGSGGKGFFQIRLKSTPPAATKIENGGITSIGLATRKVFLGGELGLGLEAIAWARLPNGSCKIFCSKDLVIIPEIGERGRYWLHCQYTPLAPELWRVGVHFGCSELLGWRHTWSSG